MKKTLFLTTLVVMAMKVSQMEASDVIRINFQEAGNAPPIRMGIAHLEDGGEAYGDCGNGYYYGWSTDRTGEARRRNVTLDCRLDGSVTVGSSNWEIAVDNGNYLVNIAFGDPKYDYNNSFTLEGVNYNDPDPDGIQRPHRFVMFFHSP